MEIVHAYAIISRLEPNIIGGSKCRAALNAAAGHPYAEAIRSVITPRRLAVTLRNGKTSEFTAPHD